MPQSGTRGKRKQRLGEEDDGSASDSSSMAGPDKKKVHWKSAGAPSSSVAQTTRGKRAPLSRASNRHTVTTTDQTSTAGDGDSSESDEGEEREEEDDSSVNLEKVT